MQFWRGMNDRILFIWTGRETTILRINLGNFAKWPPAGWLSVWELNWRRVPWSHNVRLQPSTCADDDSSEQWWQRLRRCVYFIYTVVRIILTELINIILLPPKLSRLNYATTWIPKQQTIRGFSLAVSGV